MILNFLVDHLGASQLSYFLIRNANEVLQKNNDISVNVFYEVMQRFPISPHFPCLHIVEAYYQAGPMVATSPTVVRKMLNFVHNDIKIFYVWDLWWKRGDRQIYSENLQLTKIPILCRSEQHQKAIKNNFNVESTIINNFNMEAIISFINENRVDTRTSLERVQS